MKKLLLIAGLIITSSFANSAESEEINITRLKMDKTFDNHQVFIKTSNPSDNPINCQTDEKWHYVLNIDNDYDQNIYSLLLAAKLSGSKVILSGSGECNFNDAIEDLTSIELL
ncbi:MAG: hypothetical protein HRU38_22335 [Saccharospirillaceae bacterium]|nr:hypothetical protein [Pseudomonadales bacterium]NRB81366.1 hypothetical protein [Saccharospirillaceae bacterium]